jgi:Zn-finger nucleic acid-binding protein
MREPGFTPPVRHGGGPVETRWPCPVCVGARMDKIHIKDASGTLTLDTCPRCGGLWFERGEVGRLASRKPSTLRAHIATRADRVRPPCLSCHAPLDRDAEKCGTCGERNVLHCPSCDREMDRREHAGLVLDFCRHCHGVWFDNAELSAIWRVNLAAGHGQSGSTRRVAGADVAAAAADGLVHAMFWSPHLVVHGGVAVVDLVGHAAGPAAEAIGGAAEGVFSAVLEIISGLFDGL